ncbi:hypothetical protein LCW13_11640 [Cobetia amphilecti]|uniref:hypothetical protein n=1 Tax=Cobetia amphilecti TaxID=1055104 RepID=UPI001CDA7F41|nr:hypothetical protein [Cobetia amphilecti]UBU47704.1 hypothetical protein LCW13_11640 [Cobetia amphilecti]
MIKISKGQPPQSFIKWISSKPKNKNENEWFKELFQQGKWDIVGDLSFKNAEEQFFICCYCCDYVSGDSSDTKNEHVVARDIAPEKSLDYTNILASCNKLRQCDHAHGNKALPLTPLMPECETEFNFKLSGRVEGLTDRATEAINVLNLGKDENANKSLVEKRKKIINDLLWANGVDPSEGLEDEELIEMIVEEIMTPVEGKLTPFAPILVNVMRGWL